MQCPRCGKNIEDASTHCRYCQRSIIKPLNFWSFINENASLLAAIGLIGTMISLLPSFMEKLNDDIWLGRLSYFQAIALFLSTTMGVILILIIILSIAMKYRRYTGDVFSGISIFALFLLLFAFCQGLFSSIQKYSFVLIIIVIIYVSLIIFFVINVIFSKNDSKESVVCSAIVIIFILILLIAITYPQSMEIPNSNNTRIKPDVELYSPSIQNSIGIGLSPLINGNIHLNDYTYNWSTDFGYFISIDSGINRIRYLGNKTSNHGEKIFWTYEERDVGKLKPQVNITLSVENQNNVSLVNQNLTIKWSDIDTARIST